MITEMLMNEIKKAGYRITPGIKKDFGGLVDSEYLNALALASPGTLKNSIDEFLGFYEVEQFKRAS